MVEDSLSGRPSTYMDDYKTTFLTDLFSLVGIKIEDKHSTTITDSLLYIAFAVSCIRLFILNK